MSEQNKGRKELTNPFVRVNFVDLSSVLSHILSLIAFHTHKGGSKPGNNETTASSGYQALKISNHSPVRLNYAAGSAGHRKRGPDRTLPPSGWTLANA